MKIYIETSVISAYAFGPEATKRLTRSFFGRVTRQRHELVTSGITIGEIMASVRRVRGKLLKVVVKNKIRIWRTNEMVWTLAELYLKTGMIPSEFAADPEHIAAATQLGVDVLVSWNLRHIVNVRTKTMVKEINSKFGYKVPDIVRPDEVF